LKYSIVKEQQKIHVFLSVKGIGQLKTEDITYVFGSNELLALFSRELEARQ